MLKKIAFGLLWFVVIYFGSAAAIGMVIGLQSLQSTPAPGQDTYTAAQAATTQVMATIVPFLLLGSAIVAAICTAKGILPGTRSRKEDTTPANETS
jgi:hypothetical protein